MQPLLKKRPGAAVPTAELLDRLHKADDVTMQPLEQAVKEAATPAPAAAKPAKAKKPAMPWDAIDEAAIQPFSARLNTRLFLKLKYLGETTYGTNMTKILHEALAEKVSVMLKERGISEQ